MRLIAAARSLPAMRRKPLTRFQNVDREHVQTRLKPNAAPDVYFLFPGQGSQHPNMAREIYDAEPVFREAVDRCAQILRPHLGADLRPCSTRRQTPATK